MKGIIQEGRDLRSASLPELRETLQELLYELRFRFSTLSRENFGAKDLRELLERYYAENPDRLPAGADTLMGPAKVAELTGAIPAGKVDDTSTSTKFTATVPGITELKDGVAVYLMNGVVTSASGFTIDINGLGAKPVYSSMAAASRSTTIFNVAYTMLFVYNETRVEGGCWDVYYGYNSDTNTVAYNIRSNNAQGNMAEALTRYKIIFTKQDDTLLPSTAVSNNTGTAKALTTTAFDPWKPIYYYSATDGVAVGSAPGASYLWTQYSSINLRYSFNAGTTLTSGKSVYIRCVPQNDGTVKLDGDNCITQTLPSTADGKCYIYLGKAYSTYQIWMAVNHPIYEYNGHLKQWTG